MLPSSIQVSMNGLVEPSLPSQRNQGQSGTSQYLTCLHEKFVTLRQARVAWRCLCRSPLPLSAQGSTIIEMNALSFSGRFVLSLHSPEQRSLPSQHQPSLRDQARCVTCWGLQVLKPANCVFRTASSIDGKTCALTRGH